MTRTLVGIAALVGSLCAIAQTESSLREGELTIDIDVRFISTYRDGSWVPVDIIVNNNERDIDGHLEVKAKMAGIEQAPTYRVPVDSPKGSRKRFRLYCYFDGTTDLEAMLYRGTRPALRVPMEIALRPIAKNDYLCLVLDNQPSAYSYLYSAVLDGTTDQGFYRVELSGEELAALPDRLRCYEPIDLIVMGEIDPEDISRRHRALIQRYVENGGTLAISGGANTQRYRGTWVEELAGVNMESVRIVNERECADLALQSPTNDRINDAKQGELTNVAPATSGIYRWGGEATLASLRPLGRGAVAVVALDMESKLLHTTTEYAALWTHLSLLRMTRPDININAATAFLSNTLPNVTGVRVFPRSSVATYLTIYLLVAIVGNWVFWSFMKRREMAWVCLVFFSAAFTAYAMIYGTAGRAKETELEQINILRVYDHTPVAKMHSTIGLLSARSARYSFELADEGGLVSRADDPYNVYNPRARLAEGTFAFTQGSRPRVDDLRVGASVMRTLQVESELTLNGGIEGKLVHDEKGLHGTLTNNTGLYIQNPQIYYRGQTFMASPKAGNIIEVKRNASQMRSAPRAPSVPFYFYGGYYGEVQSVDAAIKDPLLGIVFISSDNATQRDPSKGPYVFGWAADSPPPPIHLEEEANHKIRETFVVADIAIEGGDAKLTPTPLLVSVGGRSMGAFGVPTYWDWHSQTATLSWNPNITGSVSRMPIEIDLPYGLTGQAEGDLVVEVNYQMTAGSRAVRFWPDDAPDNWHEDHAETKVPIAIEVFGTQVNSLRYRIVDWRERYNQQDQTLAGNIGFVVEEKEPSGQEASGGRGQNWRRESHAQFSVQAYLETAPRRVITEEWQAWQ